MHPSPDEAWIEHLSVRGDRVEATLMLQDGCLVGMTLDRLECEWHELAAGQIVRLSALAGDPGLLVVGEGVDPAG